MSMPVLYDSITIPRSLHFIQRTSPIPRPIVERIVILNLHLPRAGKMKNWTQNGDGDWEVYKGG